MTDPVRAEYLRNASATMRQYRELAERALARVTDDQFFAVLDAESNPLALQVKHLAGNLRSRWTDLLTSDGEKPWRDRDAEFVLAPEDSRAVLMAAWEAGWACAFASLDSLAPADLERTVHVRAEPLPLVSAINRQMAHAAYHVGQIVFLAKHLRSDAWTSLSIPRGRSREHTATTAAQHEAR